MPQLKELSFIKDSKGIPHLQTLYEHCRPQGAKQTEAELSDGTLRLIAFLWSLMEGDSLLLLEEPELSLHSSIVKELPISTHSPDILADQSIGAEDIFLLTPGKEGTNMQPKHWDVLEAEKNSPSLYRANRAIANFNPILS